MINGEHELSVVVRPVSSDTNGSESNSDTYTNPVDNSSLGAGFGSFLSLVELGRAKQSS